MIEECSVDENLNIALRYVKSSASQKEKMKSFALERVGLKNYSKQKLYELSGGEQQRVAIARAMIKPTSILLADEPTGSPDVENRDIVMSLLKQLNDEGITVLVVTHDDRIADQCDRKIIIE